MARHFTIPCHHDIDPHFPRNGEDIPHDKYDITPYRHPHYGTSYCLRYGEGPTDYVPFLTFNALQQWLEYNS